MNSIVSAWESEAGSIRVTPQGQPSVFDMIRVLGGQKAPHKVWERLIQTNPEVLTICQNFRFPGRGQRDTPIAATKEAAYQILGLLPGAVGTKYREQAARLFVRFLDDPKGLAAELTDNLSVEDQAWLEARLTGKRTRGEFTDTLKRHGVEGLGYATCTNAVYEPLLGGNATQLKTQIAQRTGLPVKAIKPRDHLDVHQLADLRVTEQVIAGQMGLADVQGNREAERYCRGVSNFMRGLLDGKIKVPLEQ